MKIPNRLSINEIDKLIEEYDSNEKSVREICSEYNIRPQTMYKIFSRRGKIVKNSCLQKRIIASRNGCNSDCTLTQRTNMIDVNERMNELQMKMDAIISLLSDRMA